MNFGKLKKGKNDERETFISNLMNLFPNIKYNILGISNEMPKKLECFDDAKELGYELLWQGEQETDNVYKATI